MSLSKTGKKAMIIGGLVLVLALVCVIRLYSLQIVNGDEYRIKADNSSVRTYVTKAPRGEIFDRNGEPIVENKVSYSAEIFKTFIEEEELNRNLRDIIILLRENEIEYESGFPIRYNKIDGIPEYDFSCADISAEDKKRDVNENIAAWEAENGLGDYSTLREIVRHYRDKYGIPSDFDDSDAIDVAAVRYEMEQRNFGVGTPYIIAVDINSIVLQKIKETYAASGFADVIPSTVRHYTSGSMAAHILGRTGIIYAEEYERLRDSGYGMNDIIGKDGLEAVLEPHLKGRDGYRKVRMTDDGRYDEEVAALPAEAGSYAELTIDSELQRAAEESLRRNVTEAAGTDGAGAAIAVDPKTGEVLAIASYPTYDPERFSEDYDELIKKESNPLFNRALNGVYAPGSTLKILTSVAALETGTITTDTYITDRGKYTFYPDYQPTCLAYSSQGTTHGTIEVSEAIGVSCNYFFYDVGRRMGIERLDEYCDKFGLGQSTGLELSESGGTVAGPAERERAGGEWHGGDTLQAAIGQSDHLYTPAQLVSYISTVLNKGKRYRLHLIKRIADYSTDEAVMTVEPEILSDNPISDETYGAVKEGMRQVVADGTAAAVFGGSGLKVGGKTGTAEVPGGADNVLFTGFAPYDEPGIAVAVVIEHGAKSSYAARVGKDIFDCYVDLYKDQ